MGRRFDLIVFDWDGTLLDSTGAIIHSVQAACCDLGLAEPPADRVRQVIGLGLADALRHSTPGISGKEMERLVERYRYHYLSRDHDLSLFPGVSELLNGLHSSGFLLAVATGKGRRGLDRALEHSGLGPLFAATRCADECFSKPHPQMLEELMIELSILPGQTLMIGDTTHDLRMASNAGVHALAVDYGAHSSEQLNELRPLACLGSISEISEWIRIHSSA